MVGDFNLWPMLKKIQSFKIIETLMNTYGLEEVIYKINK